MNKEIRVEDFESVCSSPCVDWDKLKNATVLITGATGLIGSNVANALLYASGKKHLNMKVLACARNLERAKEKIFVEGDVEYIISPVETLTAVNADVDYIIHAANPTSSRQFVERPVETIETAVQGTRNLLKLAREKNVKGFVFLSSMEVYGYPEKGRAVCEDDVGAFDTATVRNCYPLSKMLCESMVAAYASEYQVPSKTVRLTQTFGPGVEYGDSRIFAEFARCVIEGKDLVLHSEGKTERCYLYVADAVTAILTVLISGEAGQAYTAANRDTYCSVLEMAGLVCSIAADQISVKIEIDGIERGYANTIFMDLNTDKLQNLGWTPEKNLQEMYIRMIEDMKCR